METISLLAGKHIVLGVTGSIAAYKAVDLASKLTQAGALVDVIMTDGAQRFVAPITFRSVTGRPVYTSMWDAGADTHIAHVALGEGAHLLVIAPITAHTMARLALGIADDLLAVTALAARCPVLIAPAMDGAMFEHPATRQNLATLLARGVLLIEPEEGRFASGLVGRGRLPETPTLLGHIRRVLGSRGSLAGRRVVVTAGGTREPVDPVRFIGNRSSGRQGYAVAQAALDAGAAVTLISSVGTLPVPVGAALVPVETAEETMQAVLDHVEGADALVMAAAVADFRPSEVTPRKIKKSEVDGEPFPLHLTATPDVLMAVKSRRDADGWPRVAVGFAAESEDLVENARGKLLRKGLDLIVANDITALDAGFGVDTNRVTLIDAEGIALPLELTTKARVGETLVARVARLLDERD